MDIKTIDDKFLNIFHKDRNENELKPGDMIISFYLYEHLIENDFNIFVNDPSSLVSEIFLKFLVKNYPNKNIKFNDYPVFGVIEYFKVNSDLIYPFIHIINLNDKYMNSDSFFGIRSLDKNICNNIIKISNSQFNKIKISSINTDDNIKFILKNVISNKNESKITFTENNHIEFYLKDTNIYKKLMKIKKGISFRQRWKCRFPVLNVIVNNKIKKNPYVYDSLIYSIDEFYKLKISKDERNLEIFCTDYPNEFHKEYFFKFK